VTSSLPAVVDWIENPRPAAVNFLQSQPDDAGPRWLRLDQPSLRDRIARAAGVLAASGVRAGQNVLVVLDTCPEFVAGFFGALALGAVPTAVAAPGPLGRRQPYVDRLAATVRALGPAAVVCEDRMAKLALGAGAGADPSGFALVTRSQLGEGDPDQPLTFGGPQAIRQLTSGTTGSAPKAVLLTTEAVSRHLVSIEQWLQVGPDDVGVSWLPLHHDMGLVGHLLMPLSLGLEEWLIPPMAFLRDPACWLRCLSDHRGTATAAPSFAYRYLVNKTTSADLAGLDLSSLRAAIVGAERVDPATLTRFVQHCAPAGFRSTALVPAYGLAEATLAVSGKLPGTALRTAAPRDPRSSGGELVSCGPPIPGTRLEIVDRGGRPVADGSLGEIVVRSPSIGRVGPIGRESGQPGSSYRTGDAGFLVDGELYVVGRLGDSLSIRGRQVFAEEVEAAIAPGAEVGIVVAMGEEIDGPVVLVLVEGRCSPAAAATIRAIAGREVGPDARCLVFAVRRGAVPRTSSGKPRRRAMWEAYTDGGLDQSVVLPVELEPAE
jgi:acyl-CoA synthetase (AMP-forming)/AMP-acid ligase II